MIAILSAAKSGNSVFVLLMYGVIFGAMYFLLLRPQRKRMKESSALQSSLGVGDEVVLDSGIIGFISDMQDDGIVWIDIADGHGSERIEVRVLRKKIAGKMTPAAQTDSK